MGLTLNRRNLLTIGCSIAAIGYLFSIATASIGLMALLATWLINFKDLDFKNVVKPNSVQLLILFFVLLALGLTYSEVPKEGFKVINRHLPYLVLPLVFLTIKPLEKSQRHLVSKVFIHAVTLLYVVCLINAVYRQVVFSLSGGHFNWYFFYRFDFLEIFDQHPTYVSMYTLLSLSLVVFNKDLLFKKKGLFWITLLIQIVGVLLAGSRMGYVVFLGISLLYITKVLSSKSKEVIIKTVLTYLLSILFLLIVAWNIPIVKERVLYTLGYKYEYKYNNKEFIKNKTAEEQGRLLLWQDALDLIKDNPILGHGTGSNKKILLQKYKQEGHSIFLERTYNVHNTYLESLLMGGLPLLLSFLSIVFMLLYQGIKRKDFVLFSFFLIVAATAVTETLFRAQGIMFVGFFYCFLLSKTHE